MRYKSKFKKQTLRDTYNRDYGTFEKINEVSLSRIWKHQKTGFIMMSAFRGDDLQKNLNNHQQLKKDIRSLGYGYFELEGQYQYDDGTIDNELSVFIPCPKDETETFYYFVDNIHKLGKKYNQESILVKEPDGIYGYDGKAQLLYCQSGKYETIGTNVGFDKISWAYSKLRKGSHKDRTFVIEGLRIPDNHIHAIQMREEKNLF